MKPLVRRVTIIGMGLIGGSLGLALKRRHVAREVVGVARSTATLRVARQRGAMDWGTRSLARAVRGTDLVVLAIPPAMILPLVKRLLPHLSSRTMLTDVASVKQPIVQSLERLLRGRAPRQRVHFIGAHPVAGSEARGISAATADLFQDSLCILTPTARTDQQARAMVRRLWQNVGARVIELSPRTHDRWLAAVSHVPHLVAAALVNAAASVPLSHAPRSFRDVTRIAQSDPRLWQDILLMNRRDVLVALTTVRQQLTRLWAALQRRDARALLRALAQAQRRRRQLS